MRATDQPFIDRTREVWAPRTARALSDEDARQITERVTGFFSVLLEWQAAERDRGNHTPDEKSRPSSPDTARGHR